MNSTHESIRTPATLRKLDNSVYQIPHAESVADVAEQGAKRLVIGGFRANSGFSAAVYRRHLEIQIKRVVVAASEYWEKIIVNQAVISHNIHTVWYIVGDQDSLSSIQRLRG
ncbi:hypothetical protein POM88_034291 [Heracleum sosnowskyi]|uniref:Uncharacterized protein n=1 Tax=Heracleum sosnowskyi TaxID=360622 RepID=A0AAD8HJC2_9APIA|nr:hypothetical protein POM88_034291 [Heracleum sosnowskyi]